MIDAVLRPTMDKEILTYVIGWVCTLQTDLIHLFHYLDGVKGCGHMLEAKLRNVFFSILGKFIERFKTTKDEKEADTILYALQWNFLSRDFKWLNEEVQIFDLLSRGNGDKDSVIASNFGKQFITNNKSLSRDLLYTFEDVFLAIVARITDTEGQETLQIKKQGSTSIASLVKSQSIVNEDISEQLVSQAFNVMFKYFHNYIKQCREMEAHFDASDAEIFKDSEDVFLVHEHLKNRLNQQEDLKEEKKLTEERKWKIINAFK